MPKAVRWTIGAIVLVAIIAAVALALRPAAVPVDVRPVAVAPMRIAVEEEGRTRIRERYVVSSPLIGRLRRITLDPGDRVRADQTILAHIEPTDPALLDARALAQAEARVRAAEAAVNQAEANLRQEAAEYELAEQELGRISGAAESGAASPIELERAVAAERTSAEARRAATFALEIARYELDVARSALLFARGEPGQNSAGMALRSPIDGAVLRVLQESAAVVSPATPLLEIGDPRDLELVIDVLSTDAVKINPGDRVLVEHWGGDAPLEAAVRIIEPSAFTKISALGIEEQRVNVIADLVTPPQDRPTLGDQFHVEAAIIVWSADAVLQAPTSALFRSGDDWNAYLVENGRAVPRTVRIGRQNARTTEILEGLAEGDVVIIHPGDTIAPGVRVSLLN